MPFFEGSDLLIQYVNAAHSAHYEEYAKRRQRSASRVAAGMSTPSSPSGDKSARRER
jgi:hypothetical protein